MSEYGCFARYYDALTQNVPYDALCENYASLLKRFGAAQGLLLDLACGTGSVAVRLAQRGYDVIAADESAAMLCEAQRKAMERGQNILFLCQRMQELDLYGTVNAVVCTLDSINHLNSFDDVQQTFRRVSLFLEPGGVFAFDVNTPYKHRCVLANNTFVSEMPQVYCVWQNELRAQDTVHITLDFFERDGELYRRSSEEFDETAWPIDVLRPALEQVGFTSVEVFAEDMISLPQQDAQRVVFAAKKGDN